MSLPDPTIFDPNCHRPNPFRTVLKINLAQPVWTRTKSYHMLLDIWPGTFCRYQTADWRFRPLSDEMLRYNKLTHIDRLTCHLCYFLLYLFIFFIYRYAREDTHYLLHIYDLMRIKLLLSSPDPNFPESLLFDVSSIILFLDQISVRNLSFCLYFKSLYLFIYRICGFWLSLLSGVST